LQKTACLLPSDFQLWLDPAFYLPWSPTADTEELMLSLYPESILNSSPK